MRKIILLAIVSVCARAAAYAAPNKGGGTIVDQTAGGSGNALVSQNFGSSNAVYDSAGADAFTIKQRATVATIVANGRYFNGSGPATSENVTFYANRRFTPGRAIKACTYANLKGVDHSGSFTINLKPACKLKAGIYWVSVVANLSFTQGGEWGWNSATETGPYQAEWEQPNGGGTCATWCPGFNPPMGFNYELLGKGS